MSEIMEQQVTGTQILQGVRDAFAEHINEMYHNLNAYPPEIIQNGIHTAFKAWLDDNRDAIIDVIAKCAAGEERALPYRPRVERKRAPHTKWEDGRKEAALRRNQK